MIKIKPVIKWVGGKTKIMHEIENRLPDKFNTYIEPFIGGGSVFLNIPYKNKAIINDYNKDLVNIYNVIKNNHNALKDELIKLQKEYNKKNNDDERKSIFLKNRDKFNNIKLLNDLNNVKRASLYIFINKTCFNGIMTMNKDGILKSGFGYHEKINLVNIDNLNNFHNKLNKNVKIAQGDYKNILKLTKKGDFVYLDPPYVPDDITNFNMKYNDSTCWGLKEFNEFFDEIDKLDKKGVYIMMSNSYSKLIRQRYNKGKYNIYKIPIMRTVSGNKKTRGIKYEVIITNYKTTNNNKTKKIKITKRKTKKNKSKYKL